MPCRKAFKSSSCDDPSEVHRDWRKSKPIGTENTERCELLLSHHHYECVVFLCVQRADTFMEYVVWRSSNGRRSNGHHAQRARFVSAHDKHIQTHKHTCNRTGQQCAGSTHEKKARLVRRPPNAAKRAGDCRRVGRNRRCGCDRAIAANRQRLNYNMPRDPDLRRKGGKCWPQQRTATEAKAVAATQSRHDGVGGASTPIVWCIGCAFLG